MTEKSVAPILSISLSILPAAFVVRLVDLTSSITALAAVSHVSQFNSAGHSSDQSSYGSEGN